VAEGHSSSSPCQSDIPAGTFGVGTPSAPTSVRLPVWGVAVRAFDRTSLSSGRTQNEPFRFRGDVEMIPQVEKSNVAPEWPSHPMPASEAFSAWGA
jgi:hypothetical protein